MVHSRRLVAVLRPWAAVLVLGVVAACSATPAPAPTAITGTGGPAMATPESPMPSVAPDDRHVDVALEERLPEVLGGVALVRESQLGTQLSRQSDAFDAFLADVGGTREGFSLASAWSPGGDLRAQVGAWRVQSAATSRLRDAFVAALQASSATPLDVAGLTLGGVPVTRIGSEGQLTQGSMYAWIDGDTILFVQTPDAAIAEEGMTKLVGLDPSPGP